ncbi:basic salivary proline-rich protein 2-like [Indicator indicator]|uniref:basic salivary proline-rich protein 2-like n=1 Tax=Indicator indicator TaxID=1002788 RepID=UPI0023DEC4D4|nr:basic salivary proline-rich protein 2-like [Indicator indicator]
MRAPQWGSGPHHPQSTATSGHSRRVQGPVCQTESSPGRKEEYGEQIHPGKSWVSLLGQPGGVRVPGGHESSDLALSDPALSPAALQHSRGWPCQAESAQGPRVPAEGCCPRPMGGSSEPGGPPIRGSWRGPGARGANGNRPRGSPPPRSPPPPAAHRRGPPKSQPMGINLRARRSRDSGESSLALCPANATEAHELGGGSPRVAQDKRAEDKQELAVQVALLTIRVCPGTVLQLLRHQGRGSDFHSVTAPGFRRAGTAAARPEPTHPPPTRHPPAHGARGRGSGRARGSTCGGARRGRGALPASRSRDPREHSPRRGPGSPGYPVRSDPRSAESRCLGSG